MENLDIIILSSILVTLFLVFIIYVIKEFVSLDKKPTVSHQEWGGPRADFVKFVGKLFDTPVKTDEEANQKIQMFKNVQRTISDMESDGVYFPEEIKKELIKKREELSCEYSGLPSVSSYQ